MSLSPPSPADEHRPIAFGTFGRRFQAMAWDAVVVLGAMSATILFGALTQDVPGSGRLVVAALFAEIVLYEPFMVARFGATVGHRRMNLRVVDDATERSPGFARAMARFVAKTVLGIPSFTTMALTRRHQAVHDRLTRTTVRIRDLTEARAGDYVYERVLPDPATLPSPVRRMLVVVVFLGVAFALFALASGMVLSAPCLAGGPCGDRDELIERGLGVVWIGASMWCIVAGWRGQLPGARRRRSRSTDPGA